MMNQAGDMFELLTVDEMAAELRTTGEKLKRLARSRNLPGALKLGGRWRFLRILPGTSDDGRQLDASEIARMLKVHRTQPRKLHDAGILKLKESRFGKQPHLETTVFELQCQLHELAVQFMKNAKVSQKS